MLSKNQLLQYHLDTQLKLQINRKGIPCIFHRGRNLNFPCFQFPPYHTHQLKEWLREKIPINVYNSITYEQQASYDKTNKYVIEDRLYIGTQVLNDKFVDGGEYVLCKNNATIPVLIRALDNATTINRQIFQFVTDPQCREISELRSFQVPEWAYYNLNESQCRAIDCVVQQRVSFIKGPPGCGKTKTIARLAVLYSYNGHRMLLGAVTNTANMNIVRAIFKQSVEMNYMPHILLYINKQSWAESMLHDDDVRQVTFRYKVVQEMMQWFMAEQIGLTQEQVERTLDEYFNNKHTAGYFIKAYKQAMARVFAQAEIIIITTISSLKINNRLDAHQQFLPDIVILDQASQASWADTYCFLIQGCEKAVFIGDDKQLTPVVISQNQVLKQTMFTTLYRKNEKYYVLLNEQHRMHPQIAEFPNMEFYGSELRNAVTVEERASDVPYFRQYPLSFIDCREEEIEEVEGKTGKKNYWNRGQIAIIEKILSFFPPEMYPYIGIISPYEMQTRSISEVLGPRRGLGLSARTCDGYQGSQREYIILSCVRSNAEGRLGFLKEENRLNVSITRTRRGLVVVGNRQTLESGAEGPNVWQRYLGYLGERGLVLEPGLLDQYPAYQGMGGEGRGQQTEEREKEQTGEGEEEKGRKTEGGMEMKAQITTQIIKTDEDENEQLLKIYSPLKKTLQKTIDKIRKKKAQLLRLKQSDPPLVDPLQAQLDALKQQLRTQLKSHIALTIHSAPQPKPLQILPSQLQAYIQLKQAHKQHLAVHLQQKLQQLLGEIEKQQVYIPLRAIELIVRCIGWSLCWCLCAWGY